MLLMMLRMAMVWRGAEEGEGREQLADDGHEFD